MEETQDSSRSINDLNENSKVQSIIKNFQEKNVNDRFEILEGTYYLKKLKVMKGGKEYERIYF